MESLQRMRAKLEKKHNFFGECWVVTISGRADSFLDFQSAFAFMAKKLKRMYKEASAYSMARTISSNLLSIDEGALIRKLCKNKCAGITPKQ